MSTPNPLIPQGSFQSQASKGASNVRIAVATIVAIHLVFFGGLLLQGCKRDNKTAANTAGETNAVTNYTLPPISTESLYYTNAANLPTAPTDSYASPVRSNASNFAETTATTPANTAADAWQSTNLGPAATTGTSVTGADQGVGATREYTVVRGDSFSRIAKKNHTTVSAIQQANPGVEPTKIRPGNKLNIPISSGEAASAAPSIEHEAGGAAAGGGGNVYVVKPGDNLTRIAKAHGVSIGQLRAANNMRTSRINVGQKLKIPSGEGNGKTRARQNAPAGANAGSTNLTL